MFRFAERLIVEAHTRSGLAGVAVSLGEDLRDLRWLAETDGLIASNDIVRDSRFPLRELAAAAPRLRWIHIIGAGIEPLLPLDWLPPGTVLTNNSGVPAEYTRGGALLMLNARIPAILTNQQIARWDQIFTPCIAGKTVLVMMSEMGATVAAAKALDLDRLIRTQAG